MSRDRVLSARAELEAELGRLPTRREIAERAGLARSTVTYHLHRYADEFGYPVATWRPDVLAKARDRRRRVMNVWRLLGGPDEPPTAAAVARHLGMPEATVRYHLRNLRELP